MPVKGCGYDQGAEHRSAAVAEFTFATVVALLRPFDRSLRPQPHRNWARCTQHDIHMARRQYGVFDFCLAYRPIDLANARYRADPSIVQIRALSPIHPTVSVVIHLPR
jgi:hypothetical protein